jgi:hypothetical protein
MAPEPGGSSPHSQQPANGPYPEQGDSTSPPQPITLRSILIPSMPRSFKWSLSFGLSHQNTVQFSPLSNAWHMFRPPHSPWFDLPNDIWRWVQIMKLAIRQFAPFSRYFIPLRSKYNSSGILCKNNSFGRDGERVKWRRINFVFTLWSQSSSK